MTVLQKETSVKLPQGWTWKKLEECATPDRKTVSPGSEEATALPYLGLEHIEANTGVINLESEAEPEEEVGISTTNRFGPRHVLYGKLRPYLNKVAQPDFEGRCSTEIIPFQPRQEVVTKEFLAWLLRRRETIETAMRDKTGSRMPRADMHKLLKMHVPVPPLDEQRRIVAVLQEQMAAVERARAAAEDRLKAAEALKGALFSTTFAGIVPLTTNPLPTECIPGWQWRDLGDIARLESGHTPSRAMPQWWEGDVHWLALPDIRALDGKVTFATSETTNELGLANSAARLLPAGTVCLSRTASVGFVTIMGRPMATSQDFVNWVCGPELEPTFLLYILQASQGYIRSLSSGATHKTVYMPTVQSFRVCIPQREEQERIAGHLMARLHRAHEVARSAQVELQNINALPAALLRQAFAGVL